MLQLFEYILVSHEGPGQILLFSTSSRSTCTNSIHCLTKAIPLSPLSCCYADLTNKDKREIYPEKEEVPMGEQLFIYGECY